MDDDELVALVRQDVEAHGDAMPPAPADAVAELEAAVGFPMPPLMKRIYLEVADGGFGYWHGALSLTDDNYQFSDCGRMIEEYLEWQSRPDQPRSVVPLLTWGCAMWLHVDFSTPEARTWGWDPNMYCDRHRLYPEPFTLAEYLVDWLGDNQLRKWRPVRDPGCTDC